ncbi:MAG: hypothetical protein Q9221_003539 [Calogaya cf. arnoldii]
MSQASLQLSEDMPMTYETQVPGRAQVGNKRQLEMIDRANLIRRLEQRRQNLGDWLDLLKEKVG